MTRAKRMSCSFTLTAKTPVPAPCGLMPSRTEVEFTSAGDGAAYVPASIDVTVAYTRTVGGITTPQAWPPPYGRMAVDGVTHWIVWRRYAADGSIVPTYGGSQTLGWDRTYADGEGGDPVSGGVTRLDGGLRLHSSTTLTAVEFAIATKDPADIGSEQDITARVTVPVRRVSSGNTGSPGPQGGRFYLMGVYSDQTIYTRTADITPLVFYDDGVWNAALECFGRYWSLNSDTNVVDGVHHRPNDGDGYWREEPNFGVVLTMGLFADFAKLGGAVIWRNYMLSANGRLWTAANTWVEMADGDTYTAGGVTRPAYTWFNGDPSAQSSYPYFEPCMWRDLLRGKVSEAQGGFVADKDGVRVRGTVSADNFSHSLALSSGNGHTAVMDSGGGWSVWVYVTALFEELNPEDCADWGIEAGRYYKGEDLDARVTSQSDIGWWKTEQHVSICTGPADEVILVNNTQAVGDFGGTVLLPRCADYPGKAVTVRHTVCTSGGTATIAQADGATVFVAGSLLDGYIINTGTNPNASDYVSLGETAIFYSTGTQWIRLAKWEQGTGQQGTGQGLTEEEVRAIVNGSGHYSKPAGGIPDTDLAQAVRAVLSAAATAYGWGDHATQGYLKSHQAVTSRDATLAWDTLMEIAAIGGISVKVKLPARPSYSFSEIGDKPTTIAGFGITDARIENGTVIIGGNSITPLTSHQSLANYLQKPANYGLTVGWGSDTAIAYHGVTPVTVRLDDNQRMFYRLPFGNDGPEHFITPWHSGDVLWLQYALNGTSLLAEGKVEATGFAITGSSDSHVLLAGGGTKDVGDFLTVDAYPRVVHLGKATPATTGALAFGGFQETEVSFEQNAPNEVDEVLFYTYNGANVFIGHSLLGDKYYRNWAGNEAYKTASDGGTMVNYSVFTCDGQSYIYQAADGSLRTTDMTGGYLTGMFDKANTIYVIHYDYCIGTRQERELTFTSDNLSGLMTPEKNNLDSRMTKYSDAQDVLTEAEEALEDAEDIYEEAAAAYELLPTAANKRRLDAADKALSAAESAKSRAEGQKDKAATRLSEAQAAYTAAGSQDYYYWLEVTVAAGKVLHLSGKALLLNSAKSQEVPTERGMIFGGTAGTTVCIGCYDGTYAFAEEDYITLPEGCTLRFEGGSIMGGVLVGSGTQIQAPREAVFTDVRICGSWLVSEITSAWFGDAAQNNVLREVFALQNENMLNTLVVEKGNYAVSVDVDAGTALSCLSNLNLVINGSINLAPNGYNNYYILNCIGSHHINISGSGAIVGDKMTHTGTTGEFGMGIELYGSSYVTIRDLLVKDCWGDCVYIGGNGAANIVIDNCNLDNGRRNGISITNGYNIVIQNCKIQNVGGTNPQAAVDVETNTNKYASNIFINNNFIDNCLLGVTIYGRSHFTKTSIAIENNYINCTWRAIAANGVSTCISIKNNELHSRFAVVEANIVGFVDPEQKIKPDDMIVFDNNMIYQDEIPTEAPFNTPTRMCAIYALKGDYMFRHNLIKSAMPVFRFASGNKFVEDNTIYCPTLFAETTVSGVVVRGNKIEGNITIPGPDALIADNRITGYWRSTTANTDDGSVLRGNTIVHPDATDSRQVNDLTQAWEEFLKGKDEHGDQIPAENYNKVCVLTSNVSLDGNDLTDVALTIPGGKVTKNAFRFEDSFALYGILLGLGVSEVLYNTISYGGTHEANQNVYLLRTGRSIVGNTVSVEQGSSVKFALYPIAGCLVADNSISFPAEHAAGCIISGAECTVRPVYVDLGESDRRPIFPIGERYYKGCRFFDLTGGIPIYWNGSYWIKGNGARVTWPVVFTLTDVVASNMQQPDAGRPYTSVLLTDRVHVLPDAIEVTMGGNALASGTGYTYDNDPESADYGKVVVANVTDALAIAATALQLFAVRFVLENLTSSGDTKATETKVYTCTLSADSGGGLPQYVLPQAITVMMGGETLEAGTGYTYDSTTGVVSIPGVSGAIRIEASGADLAGGGNAGPVS